MAFVGTAGRFSASSTTAAALGIPAKSPPASSARNVDDIAGTVSEIARVPRTRPATPSSRNWRLNVPGGKARRNVMATGFETFVTSDVRQVDVDGDAEGLDGLSLVVRDVAREEERVNARLRVSRPAEVSPADRKHELDRGLLTRAAEVLLAHVDRDRDPRRVESRLLGTSGRRRLAEGGPRQGEKDRG